MRTITVFILPLLITLIPVFYLCMQGIRRIRYGNGQSILRIGGISILIGLITPVFALITSVLMIPTPDPDMNHPQCNNFVTGFIGIGFLIEIIVIPILTVAFILLEEFFSRKKMVS